MNTDKKESKILMPTYFTSKEGGDWMKYEGAGFTKRQLTSAIQGHSLSAYPATADFIKLAAKWDGLNCIVHSLAFGDIHLRTYPRWDVYNGCNKGYYKLNDEEDPATKQLKDLELGALIFAGKLDKDGYLAARRVYNNEIYANLNKQNAINLAAHILVTHGVGSYCLNSLCIKMRRLEELTSG